MLVDEIINQVIQAVPCCSAWIIPIETLNVREREFFQKTAYGFKTAIVLGHHITENSEWKWRLLEDHSEFCNADFHTMSICYKLEKEIKRYGFKTMVVPYPGESGLNFKFVAAAAGAGEIGTSALLLHPSWGPWIHLRILATNADTIARPISRISVCSRCGKCIAFCPASAIRNDCFNGLACRGHRTTKGEYIPSGLENELKYCTICADVCPIGRKPKGCG